MFLALGTVGCDERGRVPVLEVFDGVDMGYAADMNLPPPIEPTIECRGKVDGQTCFIKNGTGICVAGVCQRIACKFGYGECNEDPVDGCEADLSLDQSCGACSAACDADESCQHARFGYACGAGVLCESGLYDLDYDLANGCEWQASWGESRPIPFEIARLDAAYAYATVILGMGEGEGARWAPTPDARMVNVGPDFADAVGVTLFVLCDAPETCKTRAVWSDKLVDVTDDAGTLELAFDCTEVPEIRGASGDFVLTATEVYRVEPANAALETTARFGRSAYLRGVAASLMPFSASELSMCDTCSETAPAACVGATCVPDTFDEQSCSGCTGAGCPDFRPQSIVHVPETDSLVVLTARGLIVLDASDLSIRARQESEYIPGTSAGAPYEVLAASENNAAMLTSDGWVAYQTAFVDGTWGINNEGAPVRLNLASPLQYGALREAGLELTVALGSEDRLALARPALGARFVDIPAEQIPGGAEFRILSVQNQQDGFVAVYESFGALIPRYLRNRSE